MKRKDRRKLIIKRIALLLIAAMLVPYAPDFSTGKPKTQTEVKAAAPTPLPSMGVPGYNIDPAIGGDVVYRAGNENYYVLLPTAEQVGAEVASLTGSQEISYYLDTYYNPPEEVYTVTDTRNYKNLREYLKGYSRNRPNYVQSRKYYMSALADPGYSWVYKSRTYNATAQADDLNVFTVAALDWLVETGNWEGFCSQFHQHTSACYPAGAKKHSHSGESSISWVDYAYPSLGRYELTNGDTVYLRNNNGCYSFLPTDSGTTHYEGSHDWRYVGDCGDNIPYDHCIWCGGAVIMEDIENEEWVCDNCGEVCIMKPYQECPLCGHSWNGTGHGHQTNPSEEVTTICSCTYDYYKFSLECDKIVGAYYLGDELCEPICKSDGVVAVVPLVDMNETVFCAHGETPTIPCKVFKTDGSILIMNVPITCDPDSMELQTETTISIGQQHLLWYYVKPVITGVTWDRWYEEYYVTCGYKIYAPGTINRSTDIIRTGTVGNNSSGQLTFSSRIGTVSLAETGLVLTRSNSAATYNYSMPGYEVDSDSLARTIRNEITAKGYYEVSGWQTDYAMMLVNTPSVLPGPPVKIGAAPRVSVNLVNHNPGVATPQIASQKGADGNGKYEAGTKMTAEANVPEGYDVQWTLNGVNISTEPHFEFDIPYIDSTLEITYKPKTITVSFDPNGGTCDTTPKTVTFASAYGPLPVPYMDGYDFVGWQYDTEDYITDQSTVRTPVDHTLVAIWQEEDMGALWLPYDDTYGTIGPLPKRVRPGYSFVIETFPESAGGYGWYFDEEMLNYVCTHRGVINTQVRADIINKWTLPTREIHARWEPNRYNVTFVCKQNDDANIFMDSSVVINGADNTKVTYTTGTAKNYKGNTISSFRTASGAVIPGTWNSQKTVKRVMYDMLYSTFPTPICVNNNGVQRTDVMFLGWSITGQPKDIVRESDTVKILSDITLYAVFDVPKDVKITLDPNGGAFTSSAWLTGSYKSYFNKPSAGLAQWTQKTGTVFDGRLGNTHKPTWTCPTGAGSHSFLGWNTKPDGTGSTYTEGDVMPFTADTTLYAQWDYKIYYNPNNQDIYGYPGLDALLPYTGTMTAEVFHNKDTSGHTVKACAYNREGCVFTGWNTKRDGSGDWYYTKGSVTRDIDYTTGTITDKFTHTKSDKIYMPADSHEIVLYAQWEDALSIKYDLRGGTFADGSTQRVTSGRDYPVPANPYDYLFYGRTIIPWQTEIPVKPGYKFMGYYTDLRGAGEKVYDETGVYCYADTGKIKYNGTVALRQGNTVVSQAASNWADLRVLYAYWELDTTLTLETNLTFDLILHNDDYDVNEISVPGCTETGIPSTETVDAIGDIPLYVVGTENARGELVYFDLLEPVRLQYEDENEKIKYTIIPEGTTPARTVYVRKLSDLQFFEVKKFIVRCYNENDDMCFTDDNIVVYEDTSGTAVPSGVSITDPMFRRTINIDTRINVNPARDESLVLIPETANGKYVSRYEFVLSNYDHLFASDPRDFVNVYTPVAIDKDMTTAEVQTADGAGLVVHDTSLFKRIIVVPDNEFTHINAKGYGLRKYVYSATGKLMLSTLKDLRNGKTYEGNLVAFNYDVWEDRTGNGISDDDIFYPAGSNIPIGLLGREFYIPTSVKIGPKEVAFASCAVNIIDPTVFRLANGQLKLTSVASIGRYVNADSGVTPPVSDHDKYSAYNIGNMLIKSSITSFGPHYTNLNYDDDVRTLDDYSLKKGITLPGGAVHTAFDGGKAMLLKLGYNMSYRIITSGGFTGDTVSLKVTPHYSLVDEDFNLVDANPKLYYMTYTDAGEKDYIVCADDDTGLTKVRIDDTMMHVPVDVINYSEGLKPLDYTTESETYNYVQAELNYRARLFNDIVRCTCPSGLEEEALRLSQQAWYGTFRVPGDLRVAKSGSEFNTWNDDRQTAEIIYGYDDFERSGYLKVTFEVEGFDDLYGTPGWESVKYTPDFTLYYDLDTKIGDDYSVGGIVTH